MNELFDIKTPIKNELLKGLIFGLESRLPIGIIIGFVGYRDHVLPLLQTLSHATRAYLINAEGLPGFVKTFDIMKPLKEANKARWLNDARKLQYIDIDTVQYEISNLVSLKQKMDFLS